ncbi:MAG: zinc finger domain-containing protein [Candidatus Acidiferrales bacterium]
MERSHGWMSAHSGRMKKKELTAEQVSSVPCPTCGVPAGERCVLNTGVPRSNPHIDRKFVAMEATEKK